MTHTLRAAELHGFTELVLDADPGAESFYERFGARRIGSTPSSLVPERLLPRMTFVLNRCSSTTPGEIHP